MEGQGTSLCQSIGVYNYNNGNRYEGEFSEDKKNGKGREIDNGQER